MSLSNGVNLIGISGHAGSGKDSLATYLHTFYQNVYIESFAGPLKAACSQAFGIPIEQFSDRDLKEERNEYWNVSPREIAQYIGTEFFRERINELTRDDPSFWIRRLEGKLLGQLLLEGDGEYAEGDTVIIQDVRFQDEYDWIVGTGGIILHITRPGHIGNVGISGHASEAGFEFTNPEVTHVIENNGTLEELFSKAAKHFPAYLLSISPN